MSGEDFGRKYRTARERVLGVLLDLEWHDYAELEAEGGYRFGARLHELRRQGYKIQSKRNPDHGRSYRLVSRTPGTPQRKRVKVLLNEEDVVDILSGRMTLMARSALKDALVSFRVNREKL